MTLLKLFQRQNAAADRATLERTVKAHEDAAQAVAAHKARKDTRGQHAATEKARKALHDRMRAELAVSHG